MKHNLSDLVVLGKGKLFLFFEARKNEMCLTVRLAIQHENLLFCTIFRITYNVLYSNFYCRYPVNKSGYSKFLLLLSCKDNFLWQERAQKKDSHFIHWFIFWIFEFMNLRFHETYIKWKRWTDVHLFAPNLP